MSERLSGGCLCGRVRFDAAQTPDRVLACHCTFCQKRTGSAFAAIAIYPVGAVMFSGELKTYEHASDESGQTITMHFCPHCSTTVTITLGRFPQIRTVPRGCFDNPNAIQISSHIWTRSAQTGVALPPGIECYAKGRVTLDGKREAPQVHAVPVMARDPASG